MISRPDANARPARVLIVDDEIHNRQLLEVMLAPEGYALQVAVNGEETLAIVAREPPDVILLDVMMPGMDGYQVARKIKDDAATRNIPIIMVTALDDRQARMAGLEAGAEEFLTKPIDRAELVVRVRNLLRLKAYGAYYDNYSQLLEAEVQSRTADLVASEARFRQLAETISQVFFLVDTQLTEFFYVSPAFEAIYGRTCESLVSDPAAWAGAVPAEERERLLSEIMPGGTLVAFDVEHRITRADGTTRAIRTRGFPVYNTAGEVYRFAGVSDDITEQRTLEAQVRQSAKMDAIGRLSAGVAHDFNNLLSVIIGFTELLMCDKSFAAVHSTDLEEILKAARRATGLTKQLLAFSRQQVLHAAPLDVNALITDMARMLNRLIGDHIHVALALAPNLSLALADRGQLEQVVMNLVVNARDAMPGGGRVTIETMDVELDNAVVHEETVTPGSYVMLAVTDTGTGMSKEVQRRVFEPFFTTKGVGKGTGLGLSTTYGIVKQSKGYLFVDSEPGKGATFRVYLPRSIREVESPSVSPAAGPPIVKGSETLLLVEDEDGVRELSKRILSNAGYQVLEAGDGLDAERIFLSHRGMIDLVITDVIMPGCGGPELVRRLQAHSPHVRVLYMSAYPEQSSAQRGGLDRNIPLLNKPFSAPDLVRLVREVLDGTVAIGGHA